MVAHDDIGPRIDALVAQLDLVVDQLVVAAGGGRDAPVP